MAKDVFRIIGTEAKREQRKHLKEMKLRRRKSRRDRKTEKNGEELEWLVSILIQHQLFHDLSLPEVHTCASEMYIEELKQDELLFEQGEIDDSFYVIASGSFEVL